MTWAGLALNVAGRFPAFGEWVVSLDGHPVVVFRTRQTLLNWTPNLAAIIVAAVCGGRRGVRELMARFLRWRVGSAVWLWAIGLPLLVGAGALALHRLAGGTLTFHPLAVVVTVFFLRFGMALTTEGVGGEAGWRGFAQERLQQRWGPRRAAILIGLMWGLCHLPILAVRGFTWQEALYFMVTVFCLSLVLAWFYNAGRGSLLVVALVHCLFNAVDATLSRSFVAVVSRQEFLAALVPVLAVGALFLNRDRVTR